MERNSQSYPKRVYLGLQGEGKDATVATGGGFGFGTPLRIFTGSVIRPVVCLSITNVLLVINVVLAGGAVYTLIPMLNSNPFRLINTIICRSLVFVVGGLSVLFYINVTNTVTGGGGNRTSLVTLVSFFLFLRTGGVILGTANSLTRTGNVLNLAKANRTAIVNVRILSANIFNNVVLNYVANTIFGGCSGGRFPVTLSVFSNIHFPFLVVVVVS